MWGKYKVKYIYGFKFIYTAYSCTYRFRYGDLYLLGKFLTEIKIFINVLKATLKIAENENFSTKIV